MREADVKPWVYIAELECKIKAQADEIEMLTTQCEDWFIKAREDYNRVLSLRADLQIAIEAMSKVVTAFKNQETMNESVIGLTEVLTKIKGGKHE
jgi:hypothetical protein